MKNKRTIAIASGVLIIAIVIAGIIINGKKDGAINNGKIAEQKSETLYEVKQEIKQEPVTEVSNLKVEKEFEVSDLQQQQGDKLTININTEIEDAKEAYEMSVFIKHSIEKLNKDKISAEGVKAFELVLKGDKKSWLFDGTENIKEIEFK